MYEELYRHRVNYNVIVIEAGRPSDEVQRDGIRALLQSSWTMSSGSSDAALRRHLHRLGSLASNVLSRGHLPNPCRYLHGNLATQIYNLGSCSCTLTEDMANSFGDLNLKNLKRSARKFGSLSSLCMPEEWVREKHSHATGAIHFCVKFRLGLDFARYQHDQCA